MIKLWFRPELNLLDLNLRVQVKVQAFLGPNLEVQVRVLARMSQTRTGPDHGQSRCSRNCGSMLMVIDGSWQPLAQEGLRKMSELAGGLATI